MAAATRPEAAKLRSGLTEEDRTGSGALFLPLWIPVGRRPVSSTISPGVEAVPATLWKSLVPDAPQTDITWETAPRVAGLGEQVGYHPISLTARGPRGESSKAQARATRSPGATFH